MKVKQNYIQPKVDIILVELENCFSNIFQSPSKKECKRIVTLIGQQRRNAFLRDLE